MNALLDVGPGTAVASERQADDFYKTPSPVTVAILRHLPRCTRYLDLGCGDGAILDAIVEHEEGSRRYGCNGDGRTRQLETRGIELDQGRADKAQSRLHDVWIGDLRGNIHVPLARAEGRHGNGELWSIARLVGWADCLIFNAPFKLSQLFVEVALAHMDPRATMAALLRSSFLESAERLPLHRRWPDIDAYMIPNRIDFTRGIRRVCPRCKGSKVDPDPKPGRAGCKRCSTKGYVDGGNDSAAPAWFVAGPGRRGSRFTLDPIEVPPLTEGESR